MKNKILFLLRLIAAAILLQTLYFKFSGAAESKFIFSSLGMEPWGRWISGFAELIASTLMLMPATSILGAVIGMGIMVGAMASHLAILGIVVQNDGGLLFALACVVFLCSANIIFLQREQIPQLLKKVRALHV